MAQSLAAYLPGLVKLVAIERINPEFFLIRLAGPALAQVSEAGLDQRIKLVIPSSQPPKSSGLCELGDGWYQGWLATPTELREPLRTYTILNPDAEENSIEVLVVNHEPLGVVGNWLKSVQLGDELVLVFPTPASEPEKIGIDFRPGTASQLLLLGDETALPAIAAIISSLDERSQGHAVIETSEPIDELGLSHPSIKIISLVRSDHSHGDLLVNWLSNHLELETAASEKAHDDELIWDSPLDEARSKYLWCAAEASAVKTMRKLVRESNQWSKNDCAFMGYWKAGKSE